MALVWMDGFDHLTNSQMTRRYSSFSANSLTSSTRFSVGQAVHFTAASHNFEKILSSAAAWRIGCAFQLTSFLSNAPTLMYISDSGTTQAAVLLNNMRFQITGAGGTSLGISTRAFNLNVWYHVEWYIVPENSLSSGHCVLMVDGEQWMSVTSGDTQATANSSANRIGAIGSSNSVLSIDDLFAFQESVTSSPTFDGDMRVVTLYPNGNGNYSQFVGSDGNSTNNFQLVDEAQANDNTDYVERDVVGDKDSYAFENLPSTPDAIKGVQICTIANKQDAGSRTGRMFFRISGTDYESADFTPAEASYTAFTHLADVSPATSSAWTESEVNGMEAGIKVQA